MPQDSGVHARYLCYKDRQLHISAINAVFSAGKIGNVLRGNVHSKSSCRNGHNIFVPGFARQSRKVLLSQVVPVSSNYRQRPEVSASANPGDNSFIAQPPMPDQAFALNEFAAKFNGSNYYEKKSKQECNKSDVTGISVNEVEDEVYHTDIVLEQEIRECVLRLHRMCTARPATYLAVMMRDFRAGLHRSNINSMFFTRYDFWNYCNL